MSCANLACTRVLGCKREARSAREASPKIQRHIRDFYASNRLIDSSWNLRRDSSIPKAKSVDQLCATNSRYANYYATLQGSLITPVILYEVWRWSFLGGRGRKGGSDHTWRFDQAPTLQAQKVNKLPPPPCSPQKFVLAWREIRVAFCFVHVHVSWLLHFVLPTLNKHPPSRSQN